MNIWCAASLKLWWVDPQRVFGHAPRRRVHLAGLQHAGGIIRNARTTIDNGDGNVFPSENADATTSTSAFGPNQTNKACKPLRLGSM